MKFLKKFNQLNESLTDKIYHFTKLQNVYDILNNNEILLTPVFGTHSDNVINGNKLYALSLTSSRNTNIGYASTLNKSQLVRITFDGGKLNNNNKSKRVDYWNNPKDPKDEIYKNMGKGKELYKHISRQDELEDRIISDNDTIPNATKYILSIDILVDEYNKDKYNSEYIKSLVGNIKRLCDEKNIQLHVYIDSKYFNGNVTDKAIEIKPIDTPIDANDTHSYNLLDILSLLLYKNDNADKIYDKLSKYVDDIQKYKDGVSEKESDLKYKLSYIDEYRISDYSSAFSSYIHNDKKSKDKKTRFIIREIGLDMKKNNCKTIKEYIKYKIWIGKKTDIVFKDELIKKANIEIDKLFNKYFSELNYTFYDEDGYSHILNEDKNLINFYDKKITELKSYYLDTITKMDEKFRTSYDLSSSNVIGHFNLYDDVSYETFIKNYENIDGEDIKRIIINVVYDMGDYFYDEINKIKDESLKQWTK